MVFVKKGWIDTKEHRFFSPLILSVSPPHKCMCSLFTFTKNIVKWQFEKISTQSPNSAYTIDKNKCVTRMWCIIHAVQTAETYLGFSKSVRRNRRKKPKWLCDWVHDAHLSKGVLGGIIISWNSEWCNFCWESNQCTGPPSEGSFSTTQKDWHCLLNNSTFK